MSKHLPIRKAYKFCGRKGYDDDMKRIKLVKQEGWPGHKVRDVRRWKLKELFEQKGTWEEFKREHWSNGNTPDGQKLLNRYEKNANEYALLNSGMYLWMVRFDMIPERLKEGDEWLAKVAVPFWAAQQGVKSVCLYKDAFSSFPRRTILVEIESADLLQKHLDSPARLERRSEFLTYVTNLTSPLMEMVACSKKR